MPKLAQLAVVLMLSKRPNVIRKNSSGALFAFGLVYTGMVQPTKVSWASVISAVLSLSEYVSKVIAC
jgi:hypothetical protein